jgi:DNA polymerase-1
VRLIWDLETDGLLDDVTVIHSLLMFDIDTNTTYSCHDQGERYTPPPGVIGLSISDGLDLLAAADERIGHNVIKYDLRVLKKLRPDLVLKGIDRDTMILAKLIHPDIKEEDSRTLASGRLNKETFKHKNRSCFGSHSLAAWGHRVGEKKQEYSGGFEQWSPEMQSYGEQDIPVTYKLWLHLAPHTYSQAAIELEHRIADIVFQIEVDGIPFDLEKAVELQSKLVQERDEIKRSLMGLFPDWEVVTKTFIAKVNLPKRGIAKGDEVIVKKTVVFNPGSRDHISKCLIEKYGWVPREFTPTGKPTIDDEVLMGLEYPEAKALAKYFIVCKTLAQLAEGDQNWMKHYDCNTRTIHAAYDTMGTVTSRCAHFSPNIGQVPSVDKPYGVECRSLFANSSNDTVLLGTDMSGLELRCLAGYMAHWDKGAYASIVTTGDVHTINQQAAGLPTRANAKTFIYGFLYGAGPEKIGSIVNGSVHRGRTLIANFIKGFPALKHLKAECEAAIGKGYLNALDGRKVPIRKKHAALNSLLQSAGAIFCKMWVVGIRDELENKGLTYGKDYRFVVFSHDELQILVSKGFETIVGDTSKAVAVAVGERLNFKCPLAADYKIGNNWAETH